VVWNAFASALYGFAMIQPGEGGERVDQRCILTRYLKFFPQPAEEGGYLHHVKRKCHFDFCDVVHGSLRISAPSENWWPEEIFKKLATSFGDELIVDGDIFYSDEIQKERIIYAVRIQLNPTSKPITGKGICSPEVNEYSN
jgi:hypothetical protein